MSAFFFRDRLFGTAGNATPAVVNPKALAGGDRPEAGPAYEDARHDLVAGRYADAKEGFDTLLQRTDLVQPMRDWARVHQGFTALLDDEQGDSRAIFANLERDGLFTKDPAQLKLANFFAEVGRLLSDARTIPAGVTKNWDKNSFEGMALLLFGLKDWSMGDFEDANPIFEAYLSGKPTGPYAWIGDYVPMARRCVHDYAIYAPLHARREARMPIRRRCGRSSRKPGANSRPPGRWSRRFSPPKRSWTRTTPPRARRHPPRRPPETNPPPSPPRYRVRPGRISRRRPRPVRPRLPPTR